MTRHPRRRAILCSCALAGALVLSGCAPGQEYLPAHFPFLPGYKTLSGKAARTGTPVLLSHAAWWRGFDDPVLDRLVDRALPGNLSIALARERVVAARAARDTVPGAGSLTSSARAGIEGTGSDSGRGGTLNLGLGWMLDPWGARRAQLRGAAARIDIADAELDAARLLLLFNIANAYVDLRHGQELLRLARADLARGTRTLSLTRDQADIGAATRLDLTRAEARMAGVRARVPGLQANVAGTINEITVLTGHAPGTLPRDLAAALHRPAQQPRPAMAPDIGIPADLLRNRPDIAIAERGYYAAVAATDVARAALYPGLSLSGTISLDMLGRGPHRPDYFFGPAVQFPTLPLSTGRARVEQRRSEARQAHETWKSTVLTAILEVENALLDYGAATTALRSARQAARLYGETARLTQDVLERGEATVSELIEAQQEVAEAERALADLRRQHGRGFVGVNVRLGAGHATGDGGARSVATVPPTAHGGLSGG